MRDLRTVNCESGQCIESDKVIKRIGDITYRDLGVFSKIFFNSGTLLVSKGLDVTPVSGMTTKVSAGVGIQGTDTENFPFLMTEDVTLTLEAASGVARVDMIEMQVQSKKTKSDYSNVIISPETGTITPQLVNRDIQYFVALRTKTNSTTATPASAAVLTGSAAIVDTVDLSAKYLINVCDGEDNIFKEIDLRGSTPEATTKDEIVAKINSALGRTAASKSVNNIVLTGIGTGLTSYFSMKPPTSNADLDALSIVFGLPSSGLYNYEYTGTNEWVKICEIDVGTNTTTLTAGMIRNLQNVETWSSGANKIRFRPEQSYVLISSNVFTDILANPGIMELRSNAGAINTPEGTGTIVYKYTVDWINPKTQTVRVEAKAMTSSLASWEIYCNEGTWGSWVKLTDASGVAIIANRTTVHTYDSTSVDVLATIKSVISSNGYGSYSFTFSQNCTAGSNFPPNATSWITCKVVCLGSSTSYFKVEAAHNTDKKTWVIGCVNGTYDGWTQLTDTYGNAINANGLNSGSWLSGATILDTIYSLCATKKGFFTVWSTSDAGQCPSDASWGFLEIHHEAQATIRVLWRNNNNKALYENVYTPSTWKGWTQLTDGTGKPLSCVTAEYDLVIDSDAKLSQWATSGTWPRVLIKSGTWTLPSGGVDLTARGTKTVIGETGSRLVFSNAQYGLFYTSTPTTNDYYMECVNVSVTSGYSNSAVFYKCAFLYRCTGALTSTSTGLGNVAGFYYCRHVVGCEGSATGSISGSISGFSRCDEIKDCRGSATGSNSGNSYGFSACTIVSNCGGVGLHSGSGFGFGFSDCKKCIGNYPLSASKTATYSSSYADMGTASACADTAAGGWNS